MADDDRINQHVSSIIRYRTATEANRNRPHLLFRLLLFPFPPLFFISLYFCVGGGGWAVIKGTQLVQAPKLPQQKERKLLQARLSAFLGDGRAEAVTVMHAVSVTSWLTDAEPEARTPTGGDSRGVREKGGRGGCEKVDVNEMKCALLCAKTLGNELLCH